MKTDQKEIYCTGPGGFWIMSPEGKHLATVKTKSCRKSWLGRR